MSEYVRVPRYPPHLTHLNKVTCSGFWFRGSDTLPKIFAVQSSLSRLAELHQLWSSLHVQRHPSSIGSCKNWSHPCHPSKLAQGIAGSQGFAVSCRFQKCWFQVCAACPGFVVPSIEKTWGQVEPRDCTTTSSATVLLGSSCSRLDKGSASLLGGPRLSGSLSVSVLV